MRILTSDPSLVCCARSGVTQRTLSSVLYLCWMCKYGLPAFFLVSNRYTYCASSLQNLAVTHDLYSMTVSLWHDLDDPAFDGVGLAGFKSREKCIFIDLAARSTFISCCFPFLFFHFMGWRWDEWIFCWKLFFWNNFYFSTKSFCFRLLSWKRRQEMHFWSHKCKFSTVFINLWNHSSTLN